MMCFGTTKNVEPDPAKLRNAEIEKLIRLDKEKAARQIKLLLLGE